MNLLVKIIRKSIALPISMAMLFSCTNDSKKVRDFLAEKNLRREIAREAHHVY